MNLTAKQLTVAASRSLQENWLTASSWGKYREKHCGCNFTQFQYSKKKHFTQWFWTQNRLTSSLLISVFLPQDTPHARRINLCSPAIPSTCEENDIYHGKQFRCCLPNVTEASRGNLYEFSIEAQQCGDEVRPLVSFRPVVLHVAFPSSGNQ